MSKLKKALDIITGETALKKLRDAIDVIKNPDEHADRGASGERLTYMELTSVLAGQAFRKRQVIRNVYIKKRDGKFTELDLVIVIRRGLIVIESKNYAGWIYGSENNEYWTQTFKNGTKNKFYNLCPPRFNRQNPTPKNLLKLQISTQPS